VLASPSSGQARFSEARLRADMRILSSDAFEGRSPATAGEQKTIDYLVGQFKAAGLRPGGDPLPGGRAWTQAVPLARFAFDGTLAISVTIDGQRTAWTQNDQIVLRPAQSGKTRVAAEDAPLVFIGYGVSAPDRQWDDFKGVDLHGKIALVLVNDPDFETGKGDFDGTAMTWYGRATYKFEEAARRGALGIIVIHEDAAAGYGWKTVIGSNGNDKFDTVRADPAAAHSDIEGWMARDSAERLFRTVGLDYAAEKRRAQRRDFTPVRLPRASFSAAFAVNVKKVISHNVVALRRGTTRPDEVVIYSAHWDHLGIGAADGSGDRIYNGAVDNASGCAELLALGREFGKTHGCGARSCSWPRPPKKRGCSVRDIMSPIRCSRSRAPSPTSTWIQPASMVGPET
jgi:hypothetical protein